MMYQDKLAVAIKNNGKVLREFKDITYLPFGAEYSILIKNLNSRRAVVNIEIDGRNVTHGGLVVNANSSVDLERFISDNLDAGNRFKFIERTSKIEQHRGVQIEDGLIRIEFEFEHEFKFNMPDYQKYLKNAPTWPAPQPTWTSPPLWNNIYGTICNANDVTTLSSQNIAGQKDGYMTATGSVNLNDAGITVPGSISDQKFTSVHVQTDGVKYVMVLKLLGETEQGKKIDQPVTVKTKHKCVTCGQMNKVTSKFCTECVTIVTII